MSKISREDNKKRFKTGMYPTQQDFENVFDSYVHKDDTIDPSKIVSGNENIVDIINRKAEEKHSHEIKDVDGLQKFIDEMTNLLEIVRDPETGEISQSKLKALTDGIAALRDDIDTNTDNVAGHESRIQTNEAALEKVYQILGKDAKESIADLADRFTALSGNYANVYAFINKVKQFLEDADASDETINRWQEIESFLQGITDTETLTGLLEQQRTDLEGRIAEAIAANPKGNYLKQISDLDGYTEAQDGEIVQYVGQTNDNYTRGYIYEKVKKAGEIAMNVRSINSNTYKYKSQEEYDVFLSDLQSEPLYEIGSIELINLGYGSYLYKKGQDVAVGDLVMTASGFVLPILTLNGNHYSCDEGVFGTFDSTKTITKKVLTGGVIAETFCYAPKENDINVVWAIEKEIGAKVDCSYTKVEGSSWQNLPTSPVVS